MSRHVGLASRVKRIERRNRHNRQPTRNFIYKIHGRSDADIISINGVERAVGESYTSLCDRAVAALPPHRSSIRFLIPRYAELLPEPTVAPTVALLEGHDPPSPFAVGAPGMGAVDPRYLGWHPSNATMLEQSGD